MPYIKCPRCHLNYILDTESYCKVCLVEMRKSHETIISEDFGEDSENMRLCPECKENYLDEGEELCYACRMELLKAEAKEKMTSLDQDMDFDEEFVVPTGKPEGEEVLMDNMEVLDYADGKIPDEDEDEEEDI